MNLGDLKSALGSVRISSSLEDRMVYRSDASFISGECLGVIWPTRTDHLCTLVEWAMREDVDLVPRGAGTGLCGGATPQGSVIVDFSGMNHIGSVREGRYVQVDAGVVLGELNRWMAPHGLFLPVIPGSHRSATIGGMIATDAAGMRAVRYGPMGRWVEAVTLVNGLGQIHDLSGETLKDVIGREGSTGFITEARIRMTEIPQQRTISIHAFEEGEQVLLQRDRWLDDPTLTALEYINSQAASLIGWEARPHLIAEFDSGKGEIQDPALIAEIWRARDGLYPMLASNGFPQIEDPLLGREGLLQLLEWLDSESIPAFGHLGIGIVHPCFPFNDPKVAQLYELTTTWKGQVSGEHGIGLKKKAWISEIFRVEISRLKNIYDPTRLINRGKLC